uniref:ATP-, maltotriose- and DNA-dependent transcriptional regulator MalT n=1 Tax=Candidatus Kentrum sp. FW TaxID=2126338 RepID=A0A450T703_9GAMM|nr:MAG: ATP-, maltotriose- and DNA-dependent transcriptional regulator MalT [Candidatus Kentron sp. FW]
MPTHLADPFIITPPADLPTTHPHLKRLASDLSLKYTHHQVVTDGDLETVGSALWHALDQSIALEQEFSAALQRAGQKVLPIIVQTDQPALQALPWETLHHPRHGFPGRSKTFTVSRRVLGAHSVRPQPPTEPPPKGPIRVLLFTSLPDDLDAETERLDMEAEEINVLEALDPGIAEGWVDLTVPDDGRFERFQSLLEEQEFHLVFLSGHGVFREGNVRAGESGAWFLFEGPDGRKQEIEADAIAECFKGTSVRCVVLSACESGKESSEKLNAGLAARLHGIGIPFVVGMRESVFDMAGTLFARAFCEALGRQERVDVAVQSARRAIVRPFSAGEVAREGSAAVSVEATHGQWSLPLLYSQQPEAPLMDWGFTPAPPDPSTRYRDSLAGIALPHQFIGRRRELRELMQNIANGTRQILITGPGGQGKTALAGRLARRLGEGGHTLIAWSARDGYRDSWERFLSRIQIQFLDDQHREWVQREWALCDTPEETADLLLRALLAQTGGKLVLFLDNLETIQDPADGALEHEGLAAWLAACGKLGKDGPLVLLTSRITLPSSRQGTSSRQDAGNQRQGWQEQPSVRDGKNLFRHYPLPPPSYGDFLRYWQALGMERRQQPAWKQRLYRALGGNFKGLELFTASRGSLPGGEEDEAFIAHLESARAGLRAYMAVDRVVGWLEPEPATLLDRLRVYGNPVIIDGVQAMALDLPGWAAALERLAMLSLLDMEFDQRLELPRYRVTPLVADWLNETKGTLPVELRERAARYQQWALEHLESTLGQALVTHGALRAAELTEEAHVFALRGIVEMFQRAGMYRTLLADWLPAMRESAVLMTRARAMNWSGGACHALGDYEQALDYYTQSLEISREIGDRKGESTTLGNMGSIYLARGDYEQALAYFQQDLAICHEIGDRAGEGTTLNNISQIHDARGDYDQALEYLTRSLAIQREIGDREGESTTLGNMGSIYFARGDYEQALAYFQQDLAICHEIGDRAGEGATLNNISQIHDARGDYDQALGYLTRSLEIQREIGDRAGEGATLNNISQIHDARGDYDQALGYLTQSLEIQREIGDRKGESTTLGNMGNIYLARGDHEQALAYFQQDLAICHEIGNREGEGITLNNISQIHKARGDYDQALRYLTRSLEIRREIGDQAGLCLTLFNMGHIHLAREDLQAAMEKFVTVYRIASGIGEAEALSALEGLAHQLGVPEGEDGLAFWEKLANGEVTVELDSSRE